MDFSSLKATVLLLTVAALLSVVTGYGYSSTARYGDYDKSESKSYSSYSGGSGYSGGSYFPYSYGSASASWKCCYLAFAGGLLLTLARKVL